MDVWVQMRNEYIEGGTSYNKLSQKYGVPLVSIERRGKEEGWVELRRQSEGKAMAKAVDLIAEKKAKASESLMESVIDLLTAYNRSITTFGREDEPLTCGQLQSYSATLKNIQQMIDRPTATDLDIEEQKARIAKLKRDAQDDSTTDCKIKIEGWDESWAK